MFAFELAFAFQLNYGDCRNIVKVQIVNFQVFIFTPGIQSSQYSDHRKNVNVTFVHLRAKCAVLVEA